MMVLTSRPSASSSHKWHVCPLDAEPSSELLNWIIANERARAPAVGTPGLGADRADLLIPSVGYRLRRRLSGVGAARPKAGKSSRLGGRLRGSRDAERLELRQEPRPVGAGEGVVPCAGPDDPVPWGVDLGDLVAVDDQVSQVEVAVPEAGAVESAHERADRAGGPRALLRLRVCEESVGRNAREARGCDCSDGEEARLAALEAREVGRAGEAVRSEPLVGSALSLSPRGPPRRRPLAPVPKAASPRIVLVDFYEEISGARPVPADPTAAMVDDGCADAPVHPAVRWPEPDGHAAPIRRSVSEPEGIVGPC